jgi:hypothetical protein
MAKSLSIGEPKTKTKPVAKAVNTKKVESGKLVDLNFKVSAEFRREFKIWSVNHDMTQKQLLEAAFQQMKQST